MKTPIKRKKQKPIKRAIKAKPSEGPIHPSEVPVSQAMLYGVRNELKADFRSLEARLESRFKAIDARFNDMESRFATIDARFNTVESRFQSMESRIEKLTSEVHRLAVFIEEQNMRNAAALDALIGFKHRQDRLEEEVLRINTVIAAVR